MLQRYLSAIASVAVLGVAGLWSTAGTTNARTVRVAGGDLQAALDAARAGDIILLDPGATYVGNFVLNAKEGRAYVTVQTAIEGARVTGPDGRVDTSQADLLAKIRTPNAAPALRTAPGAGYWRLQFLEIHGSGGGDLVRLGDGGAAQSRLDQVPEHFVIDRCYVHGDRRQGQKRGIALNSGRTMIVNSHFAHFGIPGQETQAIAGWNGPGPFVIENNYLEAAGVNLMFGGADPGIQGLVPANITIRRNHFAKRLEWRQDNRWVVKNLLELKSARHVTIEWNLLEYNWLHGQTGYAVVLKSWNQDGGAPWSIVEDVGIRYNVIRHVGSAFNILGRSYDHPAELTRRITIEHNLAYDVSARNWGGHGRFLLVGDGAAELSVNHNTVVQDGTFLHVYGSVGGQPQPVRGLRLTNNLGLHNEYGIKGDGRGVGNDTITAFFPGAVLQSNVLAGGSADRYPASNLFPPADEFFAQFRDPHAGDYRLKPDSPWRRAAAGGGLLGADVDRILECLSAPLRAERPESDTPDEGPGPRRERRGSPSQAPNCPSLTALPR
jgi:hypothetical protein